MNTLRSTKPGNLLSVTVCKSFGMRPQVEFKGKRQAAWALDAIKGESAPVALINHDGQIVARSKGWPA